MAWQDKEPNKISDTRGKRSMKSGLWDKCPSCNAVYLTSEIERNKRVCFSCGYHYRFPGRERIDLLLDEGTFFEWDADLFSNNPLNFDDGRNYGQRLEKTATKTQRNDAMITGIGLIHGREVALGVLDFFWMGGSMGTVVGERLKRLFLRAKDLKVPVVVVSSSGGARMHEGLLSLMQMGKTSAAISLLRDAGIPYISVLTDPTTGGVAASFSLLGDLNFAEPGATIGFAGRRVIENTIRQELPKEFQTAEFLLEHGMIDRIVHRAQLKNVIFRSLELMYPVKE